MQLFDTIRSAWKITELRKKILFTLLIIFIFRLGSYIPVPFIDTAALQADMSSALSGGTTLFSYLSILTGGALEYGAIFAMSVTPYINSSIIVQLLQVAIPALERLAKEGEAGQDHPLCDGCSRYAPGYCLLLLSAQQRQRLS